MGSPSKNGTSFKMTRSFLHPSVSRLRSNPPQAPRLSSNDSRATLNSHYISPSPSHFSSMSRMSSFSNLRTGSSGDLRESRHDHNPHPEREVFKWTELRHITKHIYTTTPHMASSVLGSSSLGSPMVLAANGLICIGTDNGKICIYDFKQTLKCICGESSNIVVGPVTALALSHDHTYVASGHSTGHIQLFDLKHPQTPARSVPPTTLAAVSSGRKEGHLQGSRIISIGFVAGRHTAIVSADDHGLAFSHSLGKVLFVEASDILRILGKYQEDSITSIPQTTSMSSVSHVHDTSLPRRRKARYTILEMCPLPLGTSPHTTDSYNVVALLTPTKLVVVGLKPKPRTWFKCPREIDEGGLSRNKSKWKGAMAWFPSVLSSSISDKTAMSGNGHVASLPTTPMLVYSWGNSVRLIRVTESRAKQTIQNPRTGKTTEVEVGRIVYGDARRWSTSGDVLAIQWLNANQIIALTAASLEVYDVHIQKMIEHIHFDGLSLISPTLSSTVNGSVSYSESVSDVTHSLRVYKGKIFLLGRDHLGVGTLLTWADRVLSYVQDGDFLSAINLTRSYYIGDAPGNRNGLPEDEVLRKEIVGQKMRELMMASARYAFSEDRMSDGTHITADGRGVDRTSLFEDLVSVSCRTCVALSDFEFLFEDLFQEYDDSGISKIYLQQLEPFILNNEIRYVPPRITQRLVALHEETGRLDYVERIIWHIDPTCLDINQAIRLCQKHHLYDALIYVYTRALRDCVAPVVELLGLIRKVQQYRRSQMESSESFDMDVAMDYAMEATIINAYKIYPYLSNILSGLSYPSEEPLAEDEAYQAKKDVYNFLFFGRSSVWPAGDGAKLVLTSDEDGGIEPTYPYARQLLRFDTESFLHSLDIAFEDSYLNDESQGTSRLLIVRILLEIMSSGDLPPPDATFVNIFIARNVPKYPQFLQIAPSALHGILIGLAEDPDLDTREDRQLAAEYLLSVYNPHDSERIVHLFEDAGFYRILRIWHRQERRWAPLLSTYLNDSSLRPSEVFRNVEDVLVISTRATKGSLPPELMDIISETLSQLLHTSITNTAILVDKYFPNLHEQGLELLSEQEDHRRFLYLRQLLGPPQHGDDDDIPPPFISPSLKLPQHLRQLYISLHCRFHPKDIIDALKYLPADFFDWQQAIQTCEENEVFHAVVWAMNWLGRPQDALKKADDYQKRLTLKMARYLTTNTHMAERTIDVRHDLESLRSIGRMGITVCVEHSHSTSKADIPLEDIWFQLLSSQINSVQNLSACLSEPSAQMNKDHQVDPLDIHESSLAVLRSLVQTTFASFVSITSTHAVSFPRLFKRLVNSATTSTNTQYTEFRIILTGMLESYRSDGDMLAITKHLIDRDLYKTIADITRERARGWAPALSTCTICRKPLFDNTLPNSVHCHPPDHKTSKEIIVSRSGTIYHSRCRPPEP
ncbi:lateendosome to vacuole transport-family protein [Collybia nuda]|uniref:Lateendosome to vacuole transport-family protein n=1 Tax=Collybia nuda TaxID=64659 RepID=A0A9P5Y9B4_9AGAR|nr:lateendosome to vacuole transport-family protein [Collybia nuda]